jgi:hypothetical protein
MSEQREFGWQAACDLEEMVFEKNGEQMETKEGRGLIENSRTR